ncbi:class I SAM-dependent methyltransferase [Thermodesulfobacteriota bacterium]
MRKNTGAIAPLLFMLVLLLITWPTKSGQAAPLRMKIEQQGASINYIRLKAIVDALGVTDGMTILDIGAGPGFASFLFAKELQGSGAVYATEIQERFVKYITREAERRGLANLFPVQVNGEGLDDFYGRQRYDIVFAANVYQSLDNPVDYFGKLRNFLNPGARLVLVLYNQAPLFSVDDFTDLDALANFLSAAAEGSPFVSNLSEATRHLLQEKTDRDAIAKALVEDFNRMLQNPKFYTEFHTMGRTAVTKDNLLVLNVQRRELASWLVMKVKEDGFFEKPSEQRGGSEIRTVIRLNRLFFQEMLGKFLANKGMGAYIPATDAIGYTSKYVVLRELETAGYRFVGEIKTTPSFDTVIMEPVMP